MRTASVAAALALVAALGTAPLQAEPAEGADKPLPEQLEEAIRDLVERMKPAVDELRATLEILESIDSLEHYGRPEVLPNGDIIMRRKPGAPPFESDEHDAPDSEPGIRT